MQFIQQHVFADLANSCQGFLTDLLKKANTSYDDKKLNEYTQTIVSICQTLSAWGK